MGLRDDKSPREVRREQPELQSIRFVYPQQELRGLESQWQEALTRRDEAILDRLMADDDVLTTVSGEVVKKARVLAEVKSANATADVRNTEAAVRICGDVQS